jgi:hypothetical protein
MLVLGCGWALIMPFLMSVSNRLDGIKVQTSSPALAECNARV